MSEELYYIDEKMHINQVESGVIRDIKEDINDYIENSQEPDFVENEYIYDDIEGLEEMLLDVSNLDVSKHFYK